MKKEEVDELYHLLRVASNEWEKKSPLDKPSSNEIPSIMYGLSRHLLAGGDYISLLQYLAFYGERFLLEPAIDMVKSAMEQGLVVGRVVEFGAGLGWLGRGLSWKLGNLPALFVDKRPWSMIDLIADIETDVGRDSVLAALKPDDLLVMSEFLHCLEQPLDALAPFRKWPRLVAEYYPRSPDYANSYIVQLSRYGANPFEVTELIPLLNVSATNPARDLGSHVMFIALPEE